MEEAPAVPEPGFDGSAACGRCGAADESLLFSVHRFVVSTIVEADVRAEAGVFCAPCRTKVSTAAVAKSVLLGWWSVQGPVATVRAIRSNLTGGDVDRGENAELHRALSVAAEAEGNLQRAVGHGLIAQSLQSDVEFGRRIHALKKAAGHRGATWKAKPSYLPYAPLVAAGLAVVVLAGMLLRPGSTPGSEGTAAQQKVERSDAATRAADGAPVMASFATQTLPQRTGQARPWKSRDTSDPAALDAEADALGEQIRRRGVSAAALATDSQARQYVKFRLQSIAVELSRRVNNGENIFTVESRGNALANDPIAAPVLGSERVAPAYAKVREALSAAARDYRSGAPIGELKKLAKELDRAGDTAVISAIQEQRRLGQQASREAIASWVGSDVVVFEIIIRSIVIEDVNRAVSDCVGRL